MPVIYPRRGEHDRKPTPKWLYRIIERHGYVDVCVEGTNFFSDEVLRYDKVYCNPPFSRKSRFVDRALRIADEGVKVLLLLPLDPSTRWFMRMYGRCRIIIPMGRRIHSDRARTPSMMAVCPGKGVVFIEWFRIGDAI